MGCEVKTNSPWPTVVVDIAGMNVGIVACGFVGAEIVLAEHKVVEAQAVPREAKPVNKHQNTKK